MSYRWYHSGILFASALCFFILSEYSSVITLKLFDSEPNFKNVEKKIQKDIAEASEYSQIILKTAKKEGVDGVFRNFSDSFASILSKKNISIFLFRNSKLVFWSKSLDVTNVNEDTSKYFVSKIQNGWYVGQWISSKSDKVLTLLLLSSDYPYQNKFLQNSYNHQYKDLEGYNIVNSRGADTKRVSLNDGTSIFFEKNSKHNEALAGATKSILQLLSFFLIIGAVITVFQHPYFKQKPLLYSIALSLSVTTVRGISLLVEFPSRGLLMLFSPEIYAHSSLNPSLGDYLVNALLFFTLVIIVCRHLKNAADGFAIKAKKIWGTIASTFVWGLFIAADSLFASLVMHSTITFETYRIFNLSIFSLIGYIALSLWIVSSLLIADLWTNIFRKHFDEKKLALIALLGFIVAFAVAVLIESTPSLFGVVWSILSFTIIFRLRYKGLQVSTSWFLILLCLLSLYSVFLVSDFTLQKDRDIRKVLAINLSNERDPVAEMLFSSIEKRLEADTIIHHFLEDVQKHDIEMFNYLQNAYFNGYFKKYDFRATVCYTGSDLVMDNTDIKVDCNGFFNDMINVYGIGIHETNFNFLNLQNGRINYVGFAECQHKSRTSRLYIELDSKLSREQLGYPELLLEGRLITSSKLSVYSSAKYHQNQLIAQTGNYPYQLVNSFRVDSTQTFGFINQGGYNHLAYRNDLDDIVILSRPNETVLNATASFAYIFIFYGFMLMIWLKLAKFPLKAVTRIPSFKNRIKTAMIIVVFISLILVAAVTIVYSIKSFESRSIDNLSEKLLSVTVEVERDFGKEEMFTPSNAEFLSGKLVQLSNVFYTDINLYDVYGVLLASSRPEIFERQLQGKMMNAIAWYEMAYRNNQKLIHKEQIGNMTFLSAYVPLVDQSSNIIGYLNLPYFTRQGKFVAELYSIIVAIINIYTLITLLALAIAIVISNQISKPLELIRGKISKVDISGHNEPIRYKAEDELGQLVKEYNRMVLELADSAEKLARSQRESAWREMAKQIAHEIKNPLTPMKLSLQHLVKAKRDGVQGWDEMFQKFSTSLVDQINTLSSIATEFSNFAKMPVTSIVTVNISSIIDEVLTLFSGYSNIKFSYVNDCSNQTLVYGDREQLFRAFINLVKNAVQSIEKGKKGEVCIALSGNENNVTIIIEDNGRGIPEDLRPKIFSPNFTTKSGGMGLGLAIVKGIVENTGGRIWFETNLGVGTKFYVELPFGEKG